MARLLDRLTGGRTAARYNVGQASGAAVLVSAFGTPDAEKVLPTYVNHLAAFRDSSVVFGVTLRRVELFTEATFKWQNKTTKALFGNASLAVLEQPWPGGTTGELLARMELDVTLMGNSFTRLVPASALVREQLERLRPDCVTIVSEIFLDGNLDEVRQVIGYLYEPPPMEKREVAFYPVDEVAHWSPIPDPEATYRGMSWLTPVLREVDADTQMTDYKRAYLNNAATPNLMIRYKHKVGAPKINALREQIEARHGGVDNAFRTLVLDEGADTSLLGNNFDEMRFETVQAAGENRIAVAGSVPAIVVGLKEGLAASTYSNYQQALRAFADMFMRGHWRSACAALSKLVDAPAGCRLWFDTSDIAALQEGEKERADAMQVLSAAAMSLISAGYTPESVTAALTATDMSLLKHSGLVSVQLQVPGGTPPSGPGGGAQPAPVPPTPKEPS